jgi:N-acetylmuramic acid 6-phosphate etherase
VKKKARPEYGKLATEASHPRAQKLESRSTVDIVALLAHEEGRAPRAVLACKSEIARAADLVAQAMRAGGRLFYAGAGTSGRLGALDAAELPPTFGADPAQAVAVLAGGPRALQRSVEGAEDRADSAARRLSRHGIGPHDVLLGIAASGVTPFARAALDFARQRGAKTVFITCVRDASHRALADVVIALPVGPEVVAGSTRLTAGTATKITLNAISTTAMVRLGKVYRGRMVDVVASNAKLRDRARRIVAELARVSDRAAQKLLKQAGGRVKLALAIAALDVPAAEAARRLADAGGDLHRLLDGVSSKRRRR